MVKVGWLRSDPSKKYAIKSMKKASIIQSKHVDHIENEKIILAKLDHPFSVSLIKRRLCEGECRCGNVRFYFSAGL